MNKLFLKFNKKPLFFTSEINIITACGEKVSFFIIKNEKIEIFFEYEASQLISYSADLLCSIINEDENIDFKIIKNKFFELLKLKLYGSRKKTVEEMIDNLIEEINKNFI